MSRFERASAILKQDLLGEEVIAAPGFSYTEEQLAQLEKSLPNEAILTQLHANNMALVASPPSAQTLKSLRVLMPHYFDPQLDSWWSQSNEVFARDVTMKPASWVALSKGLVEGSWGLGFPDQQKLVTAPMEVPHVVEVAWCIIAYKTVRGINLLSDGFARTCSVDSQNQSVLIGSFEGSGFLIFRGKSDFCHRNIGILAAWKF